MPPLIGLLGLLVLVAGSRAHPDSRSSSLVRVRGDQAELELVAGVRTVLETLALDLDRDGALDARELQAGSAELEAYVLERYQLFPSREEGLDGRFESARALRGRQTGLRLLPASESAQGEPRVAATYAFAAPQTIEELTLRVRVFREQNPFHRDEARLEFQADEPARHLFSGEEGQLWRYQRESERRPAVFGDYWKEGVLHIATGYDHLAFLLALLLAARRWSAVFLVVTAFTLAHTLTLALAAFDLVRVRSDLVEMAIALSIAYVGALNLLPKPPASRWVEAFLFGLIHGLGFAGAIRDSLAFEPLRVTALLGFNLGVECGQVAIVLPLALAFSLALRRSGAASAPAEYLAPRWIRLGGSALVVLAGLFWFAQRTGLLG